MNTTATHWLRKFIEPKLTPEQRTQCDLIFRQADDMFQKQIIEAWYDGASSDPLPTHKNAERYFDNTFKK